MRFSCAALFSLAPLFFSPLDAEVPAKKTICLNMIVKDEAPVICRCLGSVKHLIDYWVIVDTGSSDGTQNVIRDFMKDIPGELHERPWVNFGHNRNEALALAKTKADYLLFIDADEHFVYGENFSLPPLEKDIYSAKVRMDTNCFIRPILVNTRLNWSWVGVIHEAIVCPQMRTHGVLENMENWALDKDGNRSRDPQKHLKDAKILEKALETEPNNARYIYYLGNEYLNGKNYEGALKMYQRRLALPGWDEELFFCLYASGWLQSILGMPSEVFINSYCQSAQFRPHRAEPLYRLALYYLNRNDKMLAYILSKYALTLPIPNDADDYLEETVYTHELKGLFVDVAFALGKYEEAHSSSLELLKKENLPAYFKETVEQKHQQILQRLVK